VGGHTLVMHHRWEGAIHISLERQNVYRYLCDNPGCSWQSQLTGYPERAREQFQSHVEQHHLGDVRAPCSRCSGEGYAGIPGHGAGQQQKRAPAV
jgi:hypothetical protein